MKKTVTKKELDEIAKLTNLNVQLSIDATKLLNSIMKKLGKVEIKLENLDVDTKLSYFDKYNDEINCILVCVEMVDDKLFYSVIKEDDLEFDDNELIIGGKVNKLESYWFENHCAFDVLDIIKNEYK